MEYPESFDECERRTTEEPVICCEAYTLSCMACSEQMTEEEYCAEYPDSFEECTADEGCTCTQELEDLEDRLQRQIDALVLSLAQTNDDLDELDSGVNDVATCWSNFAEGRSRTTTTESASGGGSIFDLITDRVTPAPTSPLNNIFDIINNDDDDDVATTTTTTEAPESFMFVEEGTKCSDSDRTFRIDYVTDARCAWRCEIDSTCEWFSVNDADCIGCEVQPSEADAAFTTYQVVTRRRLRSEEQMLLDENNALRRELAALRKELAA